MFALREKPLPLAMILVSRLCLDGVALPKLRGKGTNKRGNRHFTERFSGISNSGIALEKATMTDGDSLGRRVRNAPPNSQCNDYCVALMYWAKPGDGSTGCKARTGKNGGDYVASNLGHGLGIGRQNEEALRWIMKALAATRTCTKARMVDREDSGGEKSPTRRARHRQTLRARIEPGR